MTPLQSPPAARLTGINKTYALGETTVLGLQDIDLEFPAGISAAIVGPSGSGKSTLLNLLGCLDRPSGGRLEVCGTDVGGLSDDALSDFRAAHIGFVFQNFSLIPVLTARENVEYPLALSRLPAAERRRRADEMLARVGLAAQAGRYPNQLSGGQRQRVAVARALVKRPALVLADEPTANLDSHTGAEVLALMDELRREAGTTVVIASHDPQLIARAERVLRVRDGRLLGAGEVAA